MFKDQEALLFEVSAEVCYKMGGIHTVIATKAPYVQQLWGDAYFLLGPYLPNQSYDSVFYAVPDEDIPSATVLKAVRGLREMGANVQVGHWLIEGRPFVVLLDPTVLLPGYKDYFTKQLATHQCEIPPADSLIHLYFQFGHVVENFFKELYVNCADQKVIVHFHEYMTTIALPAINELGMHTVFTTHATVFGRDFAPSYQNLHRQLKEIDWRERSKGMSKYHRFCMSVERQAAQQCHVLATVSEPVAQECTWLLDRTPDMITPNGLNMAAQKSEAAVGPRNVRSDIAQVIQKHLGGNSTIEGGKTYYFFTSGRYEYKNKGYGVLVAALGKLNAWLKQTNSKDTVVTFFITSQPVDFGSVLFQKVRKLRRKLLSLTGRRDDVFLLNVPPSCYNSRLVNDLGRNKLWNRASDRVKVLSHPEFLSRKSAVLPMDYLQFVTGCDLGIFPSLYEPYGYTPLECIAVNVPTVISNVTGLGDHILNHTNIPANAGVFIIERTTGNDADNLFRVLQQFIQHPKDHSQSLEAIAQRFDWSNLIRHYNQMYQKAIGHAPAMALSE